MIAKFIDRLSENAPPVIYGDGEQTRDFTHIEDIVEAHVLALDSKIAVGETVNIATGRSTRIDDLVKILADIVGVAPPKPIYADTRHGDIRHSCGDITKAKKVLGYTPKFYLKEGLRSLSQWHNSSI